MQILNYTKQKNKIKNAFSFRGKDSITLTIKNSQFKQFLSELISIILILKLLTKLSNVVKLSNKD